jgi:hypothetical protein
MSGLFGTSLDDPRTMGMMQLVGGLMSSPRFGQGMSQGLLAYGDTMQRAKQQQAQDQLRQMQMKQMQLQMQQQEEQARQTQLRRQALQGAFSPGSPGFLSPGDGDVPATPGGFDMSRYANLLAKAGDFEGALPAFQALQKDDTPIPLADGGELRRRDGTLIARNEKAPKEVETTPLAKLIAERDKYPLGHPMRQIYDQRIRKESTHQPATVVKTGDNAFMKEFAGDAAKHLGASRDAAKASATTLQALDRMDKALDGGALSGPTSTFQSYGLRLGQIAGVGGKDAAETLSRTRELLQGAAQLNVDSAKALAGQGAVSNFEREMLEKAAGGGVESMSQPEIKAVIRVLKKANRQRIAQHGEQLKKVGPQFSPFAPFYEVPMPPEDEPAAPTAPAAAPGLPTREAIEAELRRRGGR